MTPKVDTASDAADPISAPLCSPELFPVSKPRLLVNLLKTHPQSFWQSYLQGGFKLLETLFTSPSSLHVDKILYFLFIPSMAGSLSELIRRKSRRD